MRNFRRVRLSCFIILFRTFLKGIAPWCLHETFFLGIETSKMKQTLALIYS